MYNYSKIRAINTDIHVERYNDYPVSLSGGDNMMHQCIMRNLLGDATRHHQGPPGSIRVNGC